MRIVPDTNIIISSLITDQGNPGKIIKLWKAKVVEIVTSQAILDEVSRVTTYPRIIKKNPQVQKSRERFLRLYRKQTILVTPKTTINVIKEDKSDNMYLECAVAGKARYIVTGDPHLLRVKKYRGISIVSPGEFMASFGKN